MPDRFIHLIQSFSGDPDGALAWDPPIWSADARFAPVLAQSLAARKAGVILLRMSLDPDGMPAGAGEILSGYGCVPAGFVLPRLGAAAAPECAPRLRAPLALSA